MSKCERCGGSIRLALAKTIRAERRKNPIQRIHPSLGKELRDRNRWAIAFALGRIRVEAAACACVENYNFPRSKP